MTPSCPGHNPNLAKAPPWPEVLDTLHAKTQCFLYLSWLWTQKDFLENFSYNCSHPSYSQSSLSSYVTSGPMKNLNKFIPRSPPQKNNCTRARSQDDTLHGLQVLLWKRYLYATMLECKLHRHKRCFVCGAGGRSGGESLKQRMASTHCELSQPKHLLNAQATPLEIEQLRGERTCINLHFPIPQGLYCNPEFHCTWWGRINYHREMFVEKLGISTTEFLALWPFLLSAKTSSRQGGVWLIFPDLSPIILMQVVHFFRVLRYCTELSKSLIISNVL